MDLMVEAPIRNALTVVNMLQRSTDDATARPVFIVFRVPYSGRNFLHHSKWTKDYVRMMTDDGYDTEVVKEKQELSEGDQSDRKDFSPMDIEGVFWTREEAKNWMDCNRHNGPYFSWSTPAKGVLADIMDYTCKREIERRELRESIPKKENP